MYFSEISSGGIVTDKDADFRFTYNANSGGGQSFLAGKYRDQNGELTTPTTLNDYSIALQVPFVGADGTSRTVQLADDLTQYKIKPRGSDSPQMKFVTDGKVSPNKAIATFFMLPPPCNVRKTENLAESCLTANNYWLQEMPFTVSITSEKKATFTVTRCVFSGGFDSRKEGEQRGEQRFFVFDFNKRIFDIILASQRAATLPPEVATCINLFAAIYSGEHAFSYKECEQAINQVMRYLAVKFPEKYSGISDAFSFINEEILQQNQSTQDTTHFDTRLSQNRIYFGAPGTGKSHLLKDEAKQFGDKYERVTFHPAYTYQQFVGTYKPTMSGRYTQVPAEARKVLSILLDKEKNGQEKYDELYDYFRTQNQLTRLPILLGMYGYEGVLKTKKADGSNASNDNSVEINHGKALKDYVRLLTPDAEQQISYEYVPGPFLRLLVKALQDPQGKYLLIIEELNRANSAAVFGDVFQLLDREHGKSVYPVAINEDMKLYLARLNDSKIKEATKDYTELSLPPNFYIWATMNSADQGVFPMDTAFKRRWEFEYLDINTNEAEIQGKSFAFADGKYEWNAIRRAINEKLLNSGINEDKQLGPFFINLESMGSQESFMKVFKSKVLMYLFEDAVRHNRSILFKGERKDLAYSKLCNKLDEKGLGEVFDISIGHPEQTPSAPNPVPTPQNVQ